MNLKLKDTVWGMSPNKAMAKQLAVRELSLLVYDAVNLEGIIVTLPEVLTLLDGITVGSAFILSFTSFRITIVNSVIITAPMILNIFWNDDTFGRCSTGKSSAFHA